MSWLKKVGKKLGKAALTVGTGGLYNVVENNKDLLFGKAPSVSDRSTMTDAQKAMYEKLLGGLGGSTMDANGNLAGLPEYTGELVPGMQGINTSLQGVLAKLLKEGGPNADLIKGLIGKQEKFNPNDVTTLFNASVKNPAMRTFNEEILPQIAEKMAGRGSFDSGATSYEFTKAGQNLTSDLYGQLQEMMSTAREGVNNRNVQRAAIDPSLINGLNAGFESTLGKTMDLGTTEQAIAQNKATANYNNWFTSLAQNNPLISQLMNALGIQTQQAVVKPGTEGLLPTIISAGSKIISGGKSAV